MHSVFTRIIRGEIPCYRVFEDDANIAFLDINPNRIGHTLCVPKNQVDKLFDLPAQDYAKLMDFSRLVAKAIEKTIPCNRVGIAVVGLEVPHAHIHLIPIDGFSDLDFSKKVSLTTEEFEDILRRIIQNLPKNSYTKK